MFSQQPDQKNLLLAIVLSMGVLLLWQYLYANPKMKEEQERQRRQQQQTTMQTPAAPANPATPAPTTAQPAVPDPAVAPAAPAAPATTMPREEVVKASPRVAIETSAL